MTILDVSIVNVALPSIETGLDAGPSEIQWIVAGYALSFGIVLVPMGRLGDAHSRRAVFALGLALFTVASAACGAAGSATLLSAFRVVQGVGAGIVSPQVSGFIQTMFRGRERGKAFGLFGLTVGVSTAVGPLLGGFLVTGMGEEGWRYVFYVNVPVGVIALALVRVLLPASEPGRRQSLDPVGVVLFTGAIALAMYPLVTGDQGSLASRPWFLLVPSAVLLALFALWERAWRARGRQTLVETRLARVRSYVLGVSLGTAFFAGFTSIFLVLTLYLQNGLGYSALTAGLTLTAFAVGSGAAAPLGGRVVHRTGRLLIVGGLCLVLPGLIALDLIVGHVDDVNGWMLAPALLVAGIGTGLTISPNVTISLSEVDPAYAGSGGGMLQTAQRIGSAFGIAFVLAQFYETLHGTHQVADAFTVGLRTVIVLVAVALVVALGDVWLGRRERRRATGERGRRPGDEASEYSPAG
jgi:EmrB/QacA subfamily drug resistance transporter